MTNDNDLTPENCVLTLIDHQPFVVFSVASIDKQTLINNVTGVAKTAKALGIPTVLTMVSPPGSPLKDPIFKSVLEVFPDQQPIERVNTNAWSTPDYVRAIEATGRKKIVMAGVWTEVCLQQTALSAIKAGYEVYFISDASGALTPEAHHDAKVRMVQAGARPLNWFGWLCEVCPDYSAPEYQKLYPPVLAHGGGPAAASEYLMANMPQQGGAH